MGTQACLKLLASVTYLRNECLFVDDICLYALAQIESQRQHGMHQSNGQPYLGIASTLAAHIVAMSNQQPNPGNTYNFNFNFQNPNCAPPLQCFAALCPCDACGAGGKGPSSIRASSQFSLDEELEQDYQEYLQWSLKSKRAVDDIIRDAQRKSSHGNFPS